MCNSCISELHRDTTSECDDTDTGSELGTSPPQDASPVLDNTLDISPVSDNTLEERAGDSVLLASGDAAASKEDEDEIMSHSAPAADSNAMWSMQGSAYSALTWMSGVVSRSFVRQTSEPVTNGQPTADITKVDAAASEANTAASEAKAFASEANAAASEADASVCEVNAVTTEANAAAVSSSYINSEETESAAAIAETEDMNMSLNDTLTADASVTPADDVDSLTATQSPAVTDDDATRVCSDATKNVTTLHDASPSEVTAETLVHSGATDDVTQHQASHDLVTSGSCEPDDSDQRYPYIHGSPVCREMYSFSRSVYFIFNNIIKP